MVTKYSMHFTMKRLEAIAAPESGRQDWHDESCKGLVLTVSPRKRVFYFVGRLGGKPERVKIGDFPQTGVADARGAVATIRSKAVQGQSEAKDRRRERKGQRLRLGDLWTHYLERHAKPNKRTWKNDESQYNCHLKQWENRRVADITSDDIRDRHAEIASRSGVYAANRVRALFCKMLEIAMERREWAYNGEDGRNPAKVVKRLPEEERERFLTAEELGRFFEALDAEENPVVRDAFRFMLLTGSRRGNCLSCRWDEIKDGGAVWEIPATKFKTKRKHRIPLAAAAMEILERRRDANPPGCEVVFPGKGQNGHLSNVDKAWKRILKRAGIADARIHDLRRSLASMLVAANVSLHITGKALGHRDPRSTNVYGRLGLDPIRGAMQIGEKGILEAEQKHRENTTRNG